MGILRGLASKLTGVPRQGDKEINARAVEIAELLGPTTGRAASFYAELAPDGRELTPDEAAAARAQLLAVSTCLRSIHPDWDIIEFVAEQRRGRRDTDLRPTISFARMMQRGFALALSDDPERRGQAMPVEELRRFAIPVLRFWRHIR